eukprot:CAMPEP_0176118520 /NCGR_PEP_ID=MMETSP0120_2-20121206/59565_1 /TAXON_ID=160619 /ORGANISM="Kryptoperidinium foliaceum, Strain CCMP 1326" /LENGTH=40 /DNA_ID= /DNA_START= /DNA_END= /DNA_ORIENTATION=
MPRVGLADEHDVLTELHCPTKLLHTPCGLQNALRDEKHKG